MNGLTKHLWIVFLILSIFSCSSSGSSQTDEVVTDSVSEVPDSDSSDNIPYKNKVSNIQRWPLIPTGQNKCYDNKKEIPCPFPGQNYYGQDGNSSIKRMYTTVNDYIVKDERTGLKWSRTFKSEVDWSSAKQHCADLVVGSYASWRLPTTHELKSIVDYGEKDPSIDSVSFPDTPADWFWASEYKRDTSAAWIIYFSDGSVEFTKKDNSYSVRCVTTE